MTSPHLSVLPLPHINTQSRKQWLRARSRFFLVPLYVISKLSHQQYDNESLCLNSNGHLRRISKLHKEAREQIILNHLKCKIICHPPHHHSCVCAMQTSQRVLRHISPNDKLFFKHFLWLFAEHANLGDYKIGANTRFGNYLN